MLGRQHLLFGITSSIALSAVMNQSGSPLFASPLAFVGAAAVGSLLPDIDSENSTLGRKIVFISAYLEGRFGHRTVGHEILIMVPLFILSLLSKSPLFFGLMFGVMGHLFLDSFTKYGISFNYFGNKASYRYKLDRAIGVGRFHLVPSFIYKKIDSSGFIAKLLTLALSVGVLYLANVVTMHTEGMNIVSVVTHM